MRRELFWNPQLLLERICQRLLAALEQKRRLAKLKGTVAENLSPRYIDSLELLEIIRAELPPEVVYDIGAGIGTWSLLAKAIFPQARVHAFEPLRMHIRQFYNITKGAPDIILHKIALGAESGKLSLQVTEPTYSSSFFDITAACKEDYAVKKIGEEVVNVEPLDDYVLKNNLPLPGLIKLDVQGYELEVMRKGGKCLRSASWIICEVSFKEYYQKQPLFSQIAGFLHEHKFEVYAFGVNTPLGQSLQQIDVLFRRSL